MSGVRRIYVEKKQPYAVEAQHLKEEITGFLGVDGIEDVRVLIRYDVENISDQVFETACRTVFSEPPVDILYRETIHEKNSYLRFYRFDWPADARCGKGAEGY